MALSSNDDKRIQSVDSIETYAYGTSIDLVSQKEETKCNSILKQWIFIMATEDKIRDEKLQYNINREAAKYQHYHLEELVNMNIVKWRNITFQLKPNNRTS